MWRERFKNWKEEEHVRGENRGEPHMTNKKAIILTFFFFEAFEIMVVVLFSIEGQMHLSDSSKRGERK